MRGLSRRPRGRTVFISLVLLAALLPATGAEAEHLSAAVLFPQPGEVIHGTVPMQVRYHHPDVDAVEFTIEWTENGEPQSFTFDRDEQGAVPGEHGRIAEDELLDGFWNAVLEMPPSHPPGDARLVAHAEICDPGCVLEEIAAVEVYADGTPPMPEIVGPAHNAAIDYGELVTVEIDVADPETTSVDLFLEALFPPNKGLPRLDQHDEGSTLSADIDDDDDPGDMSCAPTAAASSLSWFADNGNDDLLPEDTSHTDLVEDLGKRAGTGDGGTAPGNLMDAIGEYIDEAGLGDDFEVSGWDDVDTDLEDLDTEFGRGQDVLLGLYWHDGGAHRVAVDGITHNDDGSTDIRIMDPWTGDYETVEVDADGNASQDGRGLDIRRMIHVSPTERDEEPLGPAEPASEGQARPAQTGGTHTLTWDTSAHPPGSYLLRVEATDGAVSLVDHQVVHVRRTPPGGFDGDPATSERLDESDATAFAVATSQARFPDGAAAHAVLSRDDVFADSLAGAPLTADGPLLYTRSDALPAATEAELERVLPDDGTVYLLGGSQAISEDVAGSLADSGYTVRRLAGPTRVETGVAIAGEVRALNPGGGRAALARAGATGTDPTAAWADSVTGGAWAARTGTPLLLTPGEQLHGAVSDWLEADAAEETILLGGRAALSEAVEDTVVGPRRVAGAARDGTAAAIATDLWAPTSSFVIVNGYRADGWNFALATTGLSADFDAPALMVQDDSVPPATEDLLASCGEPALDLLLAGGEDVLSADLAAALADLDGGACEG